MPALGAELTGNWAQCYGFVIPWSLRRRNLKPHVCVPNPRRQIPSVEDSVE